MDAWKAIFIFGGLMAYKSILIHLTLAALFSGALLNSSAQDSLLLLNGRTIMGQLSDETGVYILMDVVRKNGKLKRLQYDRADVYSLSPANEERSILYRPDSLLGYELSPLEMRYYMHGQNDARFGYNSKPTLIAGFLVGAGAGVASNGALWSYAAPLAFSLGMQIPFIRIKESAVSDMRNTSSDFYIEGFDKTARSKKFVNGFLASFVGVAVGALTMRLVE